MFTKIRVLANAVERHGISGTLGFIRYRIVLDVIGIISRLIRFNRKNPDPTAKLFDIFLKRANGIHNARILEIGSRDISHKNLFRGYVEYVGFDINPGPGVDVSGDVHKLSEHLPTNHFDAVYAVSVFEHLAMPWKAVLEINKVLKPGGLLCIYTHHAFPLHAEPWDFWRFSRHSFPVLLNEETGYEIIDCVQGLPCVVLPLRGSAATRLTHRVLSFMGVAVLAQKTTNPSPSLSWGLDTADVLKNTYPERYSDDVKTVFFRHLNALKPDEKK